MAHWSENSQKLKVVRFLIDNLRQLENHQSFAPNVSLFHLPFPRKTEDANNSQTAYEKLTDYCSKLHSLSVVCFMTTPADAALLLPHIEKSLKFQLWIAVKTAPQSYPNQNNLPESHAALLIFTKYDALLKHTKTRVQYTHCPACQKTTKDYGGKKHTYHEYGTLLSDVWRDVECNPSESINVIADRISDLFGIEPYQHVRLFDLQKCLELLSKESRISKRQNAFSTNSSEVILDSCLINDDCLTALKNLPDNSIDFCFADPPYNLKKKYDKWDDALESVAYFAWCDQWLSELYRVLKPNRTLAVLNIPLWAVRHFQHLNSFAKFQSWIAWDGLSFPVRMIMPAHYAIVCFSKGENRRPPYFATEDEESPTALREFYCLRANCVFKRNRAGNADQTAINDLWHDVHRLKHNSRRVDHPCQLPPMLMRRLFEIFTKPNEIILDCFNGAGTSTLVAAQTNRRYIGIELSPQYHQIALERHERLLQGVDPFGKVNTVPTVKNSLVERLPKQKYVVSKKELQLDVKRIATSLNRLPTKDEVREMSEFPIEYFEKYFVSWGEVCAAARTTGMSENKFETSETQLKLI